MNKIESRRDEIPDNNGLSGRGIKRFFSLWIPVLIWCGLIFFFSGIPNLKIEALGYWDLVLRKIAHITEYAILTGLLFRALNGSTNWYEQNIDRLYFWTGFLSFVYAVSDETHQLFVPTRGPSPIDVLYDTFGTIFMLFIIKARTLTAI